MWMAPYRLLPRRSGLDSTQHHIIIRDASSDAPDEDPVCHGHDHAAVGGHEVGDGVLRSEVHPLLGEDRSLLQQLLVDELRGAHTRHAHGI